MTSLADDRASRSRSRSPDEKDHRRRSRSRSRSPEPVDAAAPGLPAPGAGAGGDVRPGDWTCPGCSMNVFASKTRCFKCGSTKPGCEGVPGAPYLPPSPPYLTRLLTIGYLLLCAQLPRAAVRTSVLGIGPARAVVPTSSPRRTHASSAVPPSSTCTAAMAVGRRHLVLEVATCGPATGPALDATTTSSPRRPAASNAAHPSPWAEVLVATASGARTVVPRTGVGGHHRLTVGTGRRRAACLRLVLEAATCGPATGRALAAITTSSLPRWRASSAALPSPSAELLAVATVATAVARVPTAVVEAVPAVLQEAATAVAVAMAVAVTTAVAAATGVAGALMAVRTLPAPFLPFRPTR